MRRAPGIGMVFFLVAAACATVAVPHPTAAQAVQAQGKWADVTPQSLEGGRELYVAKCGGCHNLVPPAKKTSDEWPAWVTKMAPRSRLSAPEKESIVRYLVTVTASP